MSYWLQPAMNYAAWGLNESGISDNVLNPAFDYVVKPVVLAGISAVKAIAYTAADVASAANSQRLVAEGWVYENVLGYEIPDQAKPETENTQPDQKSVVKDTSKATTEDGSSIPDSQGPVTDETKEQKQPASQTGNAGKNQEQAPDNPDNHQADKKEQETTTDSVEETTHAADQQDKQETETLPETNENKDDEVDPYDEEDGPEEPLKTTQDKPDTNGRRGAGR